MIKYLKGYIKQVGNNLPTVRYIQNDFGVEPTITDLENSVYNFNLTDAFSKENFIPYSRLSGTNMDNYLIYCQSVDNSNFIFGIETLSPSSMLELSNCLTPVTPELYFEIGVNIDIDYTDEELSTILFAQSVLVKKGLRAEASKIGAPIPPKKP